MFRKKNTKAKAQEFNSLFLGNYSLKSRFAEAYRTLRTNIHFSFMDSHFNTLLVTSAGEEEGKTLTAANLAYTFSQAGKRVLMVDGDLRKPFLSRLIQSGEPSGLTGLLTGLLGTEVGDGILGEKSVSDLVRLCALQKKTGVLSIRGEAGRLELSFLKGELVECQWPDCPPEKNLAQLLVAHEKVEQSQAQKALAREEETGQRLGFLLVNAGHCTEQDLLGVLKNHFSEVLRTAVAQKTGEYAFVESVQSDWDRSTFYSLDLFRLYKQVVATNERLPFIHAGIKAAVQPMPDPSLHLLPSGPMPPNPSELLGSQRMRFLVRRFQGMYDMLIIDSPPILPATDAVIMSSLTDGVVFIVKAGRLGSPLIKKAVDQLRRANVRILGVVLNQVDPKRHGYYKYYEKYYSKYYGDH